MGEHRLAGGSVTVHAEFGDGSEDGCIVVHASSVPRATTSLVPIFVAAELGSATLGPANVAEIIGQLVDVDVDIHRLRELLAAPELRSSPSSSRTPNWPVRRARFPVGERCRWLTVAAWR
jgi:hypothetical protein